MKILIIEDEPHAAQRLQHLIGELLPSAEITDKLDTVSRSVVHLKNNTPDLILMDIQLADGLSFHIFEQCTVVSPVIFTTAFDEYAVRAFKVNSIDYILKPVGRDELRAALDKFTRLKESFQPVPYGMDSINEAIRMLTRKYKSRFVIKIGEHLKTVETASAEYFYSHEKTTFCCTRDNRKHVLDYTLEELEEMLDPEVFFRINRKYLVNSGAIQDIVQFSNSRLKLHLRNCTDNDVVVAREKVADFKTWLDR